jgi:hypothetical protein
VIQERKKGESGPSHSYSRSLTRGEFSFATANSDARSARSFPARQGSMGAHDSLSSQDGKSREDSSIRSSHKRNNTAHSGADESISSSQHGGAGSERLRTDSAIGIQSELQRAFISLSKDLYPMILGIIGSETPRWLKLCCQENYFSAYSYRQTKIREYRCHCCCCC